MSVQTSKFLPGGGGGGGGIEMSFYLGVGFQIGITAIGTNLKGLARVS